MNADVIIILIIITCIFLIWSNSKNRKSDNDRKEQISSVKQTNIKETSTQRTYNTILANIPTSVTTYAPPHVACSAPSNNIQAIIIACSKKDGGFCVAAYNPISKKIIRFVSDDENAGAIEKREMQGISLLDIVEAKNIKSCPRGPQAENVLVGLNVIKRIRKYNGNIEDIRQQIQFSDNISILDSAAPKLNSVQDFHHSLEIVKVRKLKLIITEYNKTRASFSYNGRQYTDFRVTDPIYEKMVKECREIIIPSADIVLSIPLIPYEKNGKNWGYYKFVAAIYPLHN